MSVVSGLGDRNFLVKFRHYEKATKFEKISHSFDTVLLSFYFRVVEDTFFIVFFQIRVKYLQPDDLKKFKLYPYRSQNSLWL